MEIDVIGYLDFAGIDYKPDGKNVGPNDVNVDCPWCGADKHLGIHKKAGWLNCWVCDLEILKSTLARLSMKSNYTYKPRFMDYVAEMEDITRWQAKELLKDYTNRTTLAPVNTWEPVDKVKLPVYTFSFDDPENPFVDTDSHVWHCRDWAYNYLSGRGFGVNHIQRYGLKFTSEWASKGEEATANRIIIPVYYKKELISWLGRDYTGHPGRSRYHNNPADKARIRMSQVLYNVDNFVAKGHTHARLVEGALDVWRLGSSSLALLRSKLSRKQLLLLVKMGVQTISVILDRDAYGRAEKACQELSGHIRRIKLVDLPDDRDVAERTRKEIFQLEENTDYWVT